jgi:hypothetical protein
MLILQIDWLSYLLDMLLCASSEMMVELRQALIVFVYCRKGVFSRISPCHKYAHSAASFATTLLEIQVYTQAAQCNSIHQQRL